MPSYEYRCTDDKCAHKFDRLVSHRDMDKLPVCPKCGKKDCKKLISQSSFSLKGGGWASDGYSSG